MARNLTDLIEDVYTELGMDHLQSKPFNRRMVARLINSNIGVLSRRGINGKWWQSDAITLVAGTTAYTYTPPAHTDSALLTTTVHGITAAIRDTDGMPVGIWTPERVRATLKVPSDQGPPEAVAFYRTGEGNATDANAAALKVLVYPEPRSTDLPCHLDFLVATIQSMRFDEYDITWQVDYTDGATMGLVLLCAAELALRNEATAAMASGLASRAEALIADEAQSQYNAQLPGDILQVEG